ISKTFPPEGDEQESEKKMEVIESYSEKLSQKARQKSSKKNAIIVDGMDDLMVRMARCCNPIPGDQVIGYITRGRGITVHTHQCNRINAREVSREIDVSWNEEFSFTHPVNIRVVTHDKPGVLSLISRRINEININIRSATAKSMPDRKGSFLFEIEVKDYSELLKVINSIEALEEVISVTRI
ncbi:MAG: bifunctional (p)ppGpp synthetase/guanosine-3',5'-bis(diphosphate) 3'-pyrophosphohydrolase, partial [Bdellovibrionales bacterium]|nr:bifunctional (p)ppGpp synthetase/guanosine-3',5'-bis(diphosphate) 3'-pyrophosphohydrolase [Bdellovibrionales bacterium]